MMPQVFQSKPMSEWLYPMSLTTPRTSFGMSMRDAEVTSPATITKPVLVSVSHATRDPLSSLISASRIASDT